MPTMVENGKFYAHIVSVHKIVHNIRFICCYAMSYNHVLRCINMNFY